MNPLEFNALKALSLVLGVLLGAGTTFLVSRPPMQEVLIVLLGAGVGFFAPEKWLSGKIAWRKNEIQRALPNAIDLFRNFAISMFPPQPARNHRVWTPSSGQMAVVWNVGWGSGGRNQVIVSVAMWKKTCYLVLCNLLGGGLPQDRPTATDSLPPSSYG